MANNISGALRFFIALLVLAIAFLFLNYDKEAPAVIKDDTRIYVKFKTDTLERAIELANDKVSQHSNQNSKWGTVITEMSFNIFGETAGFIIEASPQDRFYNIFYADSAATRISRDYPHLFQFTRDEKTGICQFRMARNQFNGYVILPTWLLVEMIENKILIMPK